MKGDFLKLSDQLFVSAVIAQFLLIFVIFSSAVGFYLWNQHQKTEQKVISNFLEWEEELTEAIYINEITELFAMNELEAVEDFQKALQLSEVYADVEVASCSSSLATAQKFDLNLGQKTLEHCVFVKSRGSVWARGLGVGAVLLALSLLVILMGWRALRNRFNSRVLKPLLEAREKEVKDAAVGKMASQLAHDIRSPLAALNILVKDAHSMPEEKRLMLKSAINRIQDIAHNILPKNKSLQTEEPVSLKLMPTLIEGLVSEKRIQYRDRLGVEIDFKLSSGGYGSFARLVPSQFLRALSNLMDNSVEALTSKEGQVCVELSASKSWITVSVIDNGKGIPARYLSKVLESGFSYKKDGGSGLGLAFSKEVAESAGGHLEIESEEGQGSKISIRLPAAKAPSWFLSGLKLMPNTKVVIIDDDVSIHQIWEGRFQSLRSFEKGIDLLHFSSLNELSAWWQKQDQSENYQFLVDYEFVGFESDGLQWILENGLEAKSILVTSRFEEKHIRRRCELEQIKMLPKPLSAYVPMFCYSEESEAQPWVQVA